MDGSMKHDAIPHTSVMVAATSLSAPSDCALPAPLIEPRREKEPFAESKPRVLVSLSSSALFKAVSNSTKPVAANKTLLKPRVEVVDAV